MMLIKTPVDSVPSKNRSKYDSGIYKKIYFALDKLEKGKWLPIEFETKKEAYNFRVACDTHRTRLIEARMRDRTVYIRNRNERN